MPQIVLFDDSKPSAEPLSGVHLILQTREDANYYSKAEWPVQLVYAEGDNVTFEVNLHPDEFGRLSEELFKFMIMYKKD